jgi:MFS family permease
MPVGPIASGFLVEAAGWKWNQGLMTIFTGLLFFVGSLVVPETYTPVLLRLRAQKLSKLTGRVYQSKMDTNRKSMSEQFRIIFSRPWILLFREPIVLLTSIYIAIVYGTLYMLFAAFPIVFSDHRGWSLGITGLSFVGIAVGMVFTVLYYIFIEQRRYIRVTEAHNGIAPPEARLPPAIIGSVLLPIGLFWFAWTNGPEIHWAVPIVGSGFFGAGVVFIFLGLINYLVDSYVVFAASALAANSLLRSIFGAVFPLITPSIYNGLDIHWGSSIPAFLSVLCMPWPFLFYCYGERIRSKCKYAAEAEKIMKNMLGEPETQSQQNLFDDVGGEGYRMDELDRRLKRLAEVDRNKRWTL